MQDKLSHMARTTLTIMILAMVATVITLTLEVGGKINVPIHTFVAIASVGAAGAAGWIAINCTTQIIQYIDYRITQRDTDTDRRINALVNSLTEVRITISEFAKVVEEFGDQRATAARIEALTALADASRLTESARGVSPIRRQAAP